GNLEASNYYVNDDGLKSLVFYMNTLASTTTTNTVAGQGVQAAASLIMFLPNLILFCFLQNKVINTKAHSGIK
ncbi:MAG: carbohydrate ABC transporter permease, partial [Lachnospiraceae bacterium]|nr:carbohydrate ABC transporter permease [Lachnospiraceae bacterium]